MDVAKLLSAFLTTALGFLLTSLLDRSKLAEAGARVWALYVSTTAFLVAISLFLLTLSAYDLLLMPERFWEEEEPPREPRLRPGWLVWRPPSSSVWVLYQNMLRVWRYYFTTAAYALVLGLVLLAYVVLRDVGEVEFAFSVVALTAGLYVYRKIVGPKIGTQD
jgi:hypothetical protein